MLAAHTVAARHDSPGEHSSRRGTTPNEVVFGKGGEEVIEPRTETHPRGAKAFANPLIEARVREISRALDYKLATHGEFSEAAKPFDAAAPHIYSTGGSSFFSCTRRNDEPLAK
jgi:hypothetical protein